VSAEQFAALLGPAGWRSGADAAGYARDWLDRFGVPPLGVARPASTPEVAAVVALCRAQGIALTPQGGRTSLCGAAVTPDPRGVILSLERMTAIGAPDRDSGTVTVEAGVVLAALHAALEGSGQIFPLRLGAEGSARIGGLIATNAGGSHAARYGTMQDLVYGLEVVLPDGTVWNGLRAVQKDNAGYQLRRLFCGAEGTLGIVTRAVLKLAPAPQARATAFLALRDAAALVAFGRAIRAEAAEFLSGLEFFSETGLVLALKHVPNLTYPLGSRASFYLLVELEAGSPKVPLDAILEDAIARGLERGEILDGAIAASEAQRRMFWRLREEQPEGQRLEGAQLKHDIAVPPGRIADYIAAGAAFCAGHLPGIRINPFGHLADGNIHYNLTVPEGRSDFAGLAATLDEGLARLAESMGGSFAAEHGLGRSKIALADALRSPAERALMRAIKQALDPNGTLNPGVIVSGEES
jgi:FAD/FMN-containing dehydrogenase